MKEDQNTLTLAAITRQYFAGNEAAMRKWMVHPNTQLEGQLPLSVMAQPNGYVSVRAAAALTVPALAVQ